ncbi:MAG: hypothetical protein US49_C0003G0109, partial [candidate division TM6 bacterium GW2011_GWF2_37_49]
MIKKIYLLLCIACTVNFLVRSNNDNLIGTASILAPSFLWGSALNGAVALEKELVMNVWDLAWNRKKADPKAGEKKDKLIDPENALPLIKVVDGLFHRPRGTVGRAAFGPTETIKPEDTKRIAKIVGILVALSPLIKDICEQINKKSNQLKTYLPQSKEAYKAMDEDLKQFVNFSGKIIKVFSSATTKEGQKPDPVADIFRIASQETGYLKNAEDAFNQYLQVSPTPDEKIASRHKIVKELVSDIYKIYLFKLTCDSLDENNKSLSTMITLASIQNQKETTMILQALLWACCKDDRMALMIYYQTLNGVVRDVANKSIFMEGKEPEWDHWLVMDKLDQSTVSERIQQIQKDTETPEAIEKMLQTPDFWERLMRIYLMPGKYPQISTHKHATLWINGKTLQSNDLTSGQLVITQYEDCVEAMIFNIVCILAYDSETKSFSLKKLQSRLKQAKLNDKLIKFFTNQHPALNTEKGIIPVDPSTMENIFVHSAWTDVISNIAGVTYANTLVGNTRTKLERSHFIIAPPQKHAALRTAGYEPQSESTICFEMQPPLKNVIVALNDILGLGLFDKANVYDEIVKPNFVEQYLPIMAAKLDIKMEPKCGVSKSVEEAERCTQDYLITNVFFEKEKPAEFALATASSMHGELRQLIKDREWNKTITVVFNHIFGYPKSSALQALFAQLQCLNFLELRFIFDYLRSKNHEWGWGADEFIKNIPNPIINAESIYFSLFGLNIKDFFIYYYLCATLNYQKIKINKLTQNLFFRIARLETDLNIKLMKYRHIFDTLHDVDGFEDEENLKDALDTAKAAVASNDDSLMWNGINLFKSIVQQRKAFDVACGAAMSTLSSQTYTGRIESLHLLAELVKQGQCYDEVISAATAECKNSSESVRKHSLQLFLELVKQGRGIPEAEAILRQGSDPDYDVRQAASELATEIAARQAPQHDPQITTAFAAAAAEAIGIPVPAPIPAPEPEPQPAVQPETIAMPTPEPKPQPEQKPALADNPPTGNYLDTAIAELKDKKFESLDSKDFKDQLTSYLKQNTDSNKKIYQLLDAGASIKMLIQRCKLGDQSQNMLKLKLLGIYLNYQSGQRLYPVLEQAKMALIKFKNLGTSGWNKFIN